MSAAETRYQDWSQAPGNQGGVVFHPYGDRFEVWDKPDGVRSILAWNYKGVADGWHYESPRDGAQGQVFDLNLREGRHIYFRITAIGASGYISEYRTSGR